MTTQCLHVFLLFLTCNFCFQLFGMSLRPLYLSPFLLCSCQVNVLFDAILTMHLPFGRSLPARDGFPPTGPHEALLRQRQSVAWVQQQHLWHEDPRIDSGPFGRQHLGSPPTSSNGSVLAVGGGATRRSVPDIFGCGLNSPKRLEVRDLEGEARDVDVRAGSLQKSVEHL